MIVPKNVSELIVGIDKLMTRRGDNGDSVAGLLEQGTVTLFALSQLAVLSVDQSEQQRNNYDVNRG